MQEVFGIYLQNAGFSVEKACSVEEAQQTMTNYQPDLTILDVVMGGRSGFEFYLQLKKSKQTC